MRCACVPPWRQQCLTVRCIWLADGSRAKERKAAIHKALTGTDYDVMVNPKYIVQEKNRLFSRTVTVQVAGYGGHLVFESHEE